MTRRDDSRKGRRGELREAAPASPALFPMCLRLAGRKVLVVGAGNVAQPKIESLLCAGASVRVIAPTATRRVAGWAREGRVNWAQREFHPDDLKGAFLVIAGTSSPEIHAQILRLARRRGILCNVVDDPDRCDFFYPAVVRRGDLQIVVSTGGASPALAQRLRKEINAQLPLDAGDWLTDLGNLRREVTQMEPLNEERKWLLHQLAQREVCGYHL